MDAGPVLIGLLQEYSDWEIGLLAPALRAGFGMWKNTFRIVVLGPTAVPLVSLGGFRTPPDCLIADAPDDFSALILVGGMAWFGDDAAQFIPLARRAVDKGVVLAGICNGSTFLAKNGFLDNVDHTSNDLNDLKIFPGYHGEQRFRNRPSVRDGKIVTANGLGFIEFAREVLLALNPAESDQILEFYAMVKRGSFVEY